MPNPIFYRERRKYPRVVMDLPVDYWVKRDSHPHGAIVVDASESGFLVHAIEDLPVGSELRMALLFSKEFELAELRVHAEVIRKRMAEGGEEGYEYGIRFTQILKEDHTKLRELFIEKLLSA